jgi:hypothetical protein
MERAGEKETGRKADRVIVLLQLNIQRDILHIFHNLYTGNQSLSLPELKEKN